MCTIQMAKARTDIVKDVRSYGLDDLLEHFGLERRAEGAKHDAEDDCLRTAELYSILHKGEKVVIKQNKK